MLKASPVIPREGFSIALPVKLKKLIVILPTHEIGSNKVIRKAPLPTQKKFPFVNFRGKSVGSKGKLRNKCRKGE